MTEPLDINFSEFDEYIRQGEPDQQEKAGIWSVAIGLQQVDQLQTSEYLRQTAKRNIDGEITMAQATKAIHEYYVSKTHHDAGDADQEEADKVSTNIANILKSKTFNFSTLGFTSIHRRVFEGVMKNAGELRQYDITKKEWVLGGDTVLYLNWEDLRQALDYDLAREKEFVYKGLTTDEKIAHLAQFVSGLWQIHAFPEGNTRTTAVFVIQYLRSLGWDVDNNMFAKHAWYFRNALVRANYRNDKLGIEYTPVYLERFFRNLLLGESWDLRSRYLYLTPTNEWKVQPQSSVKNPKSSVKSPKSSVKSPKSSVKIVELMKGNTNITISELATAIGISVRAVEKQIKSLREANIIRRIGPDKGGHWEVL